MKALKPKRKANKVSSYARLCLLEGGCQGLVFPSCMTTETMVGHKVYVCRYHCVCVFVRVCVHKELRNKVKHR